MSSHRLVSHEEWIAARKALLAKEKEFSRLREELNRRRRDLPWEAVDKEYVFDGRDGRQSLVELFEGKSQLIVYHFMFDPDWDAGCPHCSFWADNFNPIIVHLNQRDVTMIAVSRAPYSKLAAYQKRMGWSFKWVSSGGTDFNFVYHVSFTPDEVRSKAGYYNFGITPPPNTEAAGISVFSKDASGKVFHTYSTYRRGIDMMNTAYHYLDLTPKGRDEAGRGDPQFWVRRHEIGR